MKLFEDKRARLAEFSREQAAKVKAAQESKAPRSEEPAAALEPEAASVAGGTDVKLAAPPAAGSVDVQDLSLEVILDSPYQPRQRVLTKRDVEDLMRSIAANGQTAPIIVTGASEQAGHYYVHAGHRRCAALRFLGAKTVKAIVRTDLDERGARRLVLGDNLGREDLTAYEQAIALRDFRQAFGLSVEDAAKDLGLKARTAFRLSAVLSVSEPLQEIFRDENISARAAEALSKIDSIDAKKAQRLARKYAAGSLSLQGLDEEVRKAESAAQRPVRVARDVELKQDGRSLQLKLALVSEQLTATQVQRVVSALAQVLAYLKIGKVEAAPFTPEAP